MLTSPESQGFHQQGPDDEALESHSSHRWTFPTGQGAFGSVEQKNKPPTLGI